jgi:phosphoribosylformylglycinamidine synthase II
MTYCVEVSIKPGFPDARGAGLLRQVEALGIDGAQSLAVADLYFLHGELTEDAVQQLVDLLLHDPVVEVARWQRLETLARPAMPPDTWAVEVTLLPGVTDSVAESLLAGAAMIGVDGLRQAASGQRYILAGRLSQQELERIARGLLANEVIQRYHIDELAAPPFVAEMQWATWDVMGDAVEVIPLREVDDAGLLAISRERRLSLDLAEMQAIQGYYRREGREPTDVELEMLAQTWSEHCVHKTFKAVIEYVGPQDTTADGAQRMAEDTTADEAQRMAEEDTTADEAQRMAEEDTTADEAQRMAEAGHGSGEAPQTGSDHRSPITDHRLPITDHRSPFTVHRIDGLLKSYIRAATERVAKPWVRSAFVDNAGIVAFDEQFDLAFKVETHNHPSALEPFGGANTGVGGVVRDVIGVSARPIANTDILFFGPRDLPWERLPAGVLHPRRIADGVVAGIEDYGNKMGIPTVNGALFTDEGYTANPLVFCGCLGILPHGSHRTAPQPGDLVVVIGGRTGRDGLRGATFSSMEMDHQTGAIAGSAVQIGHPIHEKQVLEAVLQARDEGLYTAITDCGAGGLSSAIGEMGSQLGAVVHLERAPLKYPGLRPWEIWLSEAQERMVLAVSPAHWPRFQAICAGVDVEATALGQFTGDGRLRIYYGDDLVGDIDVDFLHDGIPRRHLRAEWSPPPLPITHYPFTINHLTETLLALLALPETRSKEPIVRQYDHEVQGGTLVKPFTGAANAGPSDAAVLAPLDALRRTVNGERSTADGGTGRGVALAVGANPFYTALDPYCMAWAAVDEALRNVVAVGADPDQVSLLDNFSWGNPNLPDRLGSLVRCVQGCYDAAVAFGAPFISGKDSLNNEYTGVDGQKHAIPGTLVVSALAIVPDIDRTVTMDLKAAGNLIYIVGQTRGELGGSVLERIHPHPQPLSLRGRGESALTPNPSPRGRGESGPPLPTGEGLGVRVVPQPPANALATYRALHQAIGSGLVRACHDCSEGGLAVATAEMALAGGLGLELRLADVPRAADVDSDTAIAFCESLGRLLVEVHPTATDQFEVLLAGHSIARIGHVRADNRIVMAGLDDQFVIDTDLAAVAGAWRNE